MTNYLLALDPGRAKVGAAVLNYKAQVQEKTIVPLEELKDYLTELESNYKLRELIVGNGTGAERVIELLKENFDFKKINLVAEEFTTEAAQRRYLEEKPMSNYEKLLRKFISWKVKKPLDDYAALIIGEKYLKKLDKNSAGTYNSD
ncbi:MAG: resolvase [Bacillota bacterium]